MLERATTELQTWVSSFSALSNAAEDVWFLDQEDYSETSRDAFLWDSFAELSLEASHDLDSTAAIISFWGRHLPFLLSVRGPYAYLAEREDGAVVYGEEPEFEETTVVASNLESFLDLLVRNEFTEVGSLRALFFAPAA